MSSCGGTSAQMLCQLVMLAKAGSSLAPKSVIARQRQLRRLSFLAQKLCQCQVVVARRRKCCAKVATVLRPWRVLGAKAVPTSYVGKSWQQPCPKASNCKA
ncbi:MAG: hypothetical protein RR769_07640, partial [Anaerovoracaceae bacterium]